MTDSAKIVITVVTEIHTTVEKVWIFWINPKYIIHWNKASDDWHTPKADNNLRAGGRFL